MLLTPSPPKRECGARPEVLSQSTPRSQPRPFRRRLKREHGEDVSLLAVTAPLRNSAAQRSSQERCARLGLTPAQRSLGQLLTEKRSQCPDFGTVTVTSRVLALPLASRLSTVIV